MNAPDRELIQSLLRRRPEEVTDAEIETAIRLVMPDSHATVIRHSKSAEDAEDTHSRPV